MSNFDNDQFFDEDGNLIQTAWGLKAEQEEEEERKRNEEQEKLRKRKELNRRAAIDNSQAEFMDQHEKALKKRKIREEWMTLPSWIKKMPRTPLSAPPTYGNKEMFLTKITGKTHLSDKERKERTKNLTRVKMSVSVYHAIHRNLAVDKLDPVMIMSMGEDAGGTMVTRGVSAALFESRGDLGTVVSMDFSPAGSKFDEWFGLSSNNFVSMKTVHRWFTTQENHLGVESIPTNNGVEYHLSNRPEKNKRLPLDISAVVDMYKAIINEKGFMLMDCDRREQEIAAVAATLSVTPVFVVPINKSAITEINTFFDNLRAMGASEEKISELKTNAIIVASSVVPEMSSSQGRDAIKSFLGKVAEECGIDGGKDDERLIHLYYDKGLQEKPMRWKNLGFLAKHSFRSIAALIVDDVAQEIG